MRILTDAHERVLVAAVKFCRLQLDENETSAGFVAKQGEARRALEEAVEAMMDGRIG